MGTETARAVELVAMLAALLPNQERVRVGAEKHAYYASCMEAVMALLFRGSAAWLEVAAGSRDVIAAFIVDSANWDGIAHDGLANKRVFDFVGGSPVSAEEDYAPVRLGVYERDRSAIVEGRCSKVAEHVVTGEGNMFGWEAPLTAIFRLATRKHVLQCGAARSERVLRGKIAEAGRMIRERESEIRELQKEIDGYKVDPTPKRIRMALDELHEGGTHTL